MITVLHVSHILNRYDFIDVVLRAADPGAFRMLAATFTEDGSITSQERGYPVTCLGVRGRRDFLRGRRRLRALIRREGVDLVHSHHFDPMLLSALALRGLPRPRLVIGRHYSDALHQLRPAWKRRAYLALESWCNRAAARILAPSAMVRQILVERQGVPAQKVAEVPYGFDWSKYALGDPSAPARLRKALGLNGHPVIGTFSRLNADKGHVFLLRAMAQLRQRWPHLRLLLAGDGNAREALERDVERLGLREHVIFAGWRGDVVPLTAMVDAVVQPTLHEAFSQVMVEALAMGKPLIISDVSGVRDTIRHGWNGLVVPQRDAEALTAAINQVLEQPQDAQAMGRRGQEMVRQRLDIQAVIARYEACYREVVDEMSMGS